MNMSWSEISRKILDSNNITIDEDERMPTKPLTVYRREDKGVSWPYIINL